MIDLYDVLCIDLDAKEEDIKKAYRRLSLQHHPDKVHSQPANGEVSSEKFQEIKLAHDILKDPERRKIYDTFGIDLGEERPEMEVWTIGMSTLLTPIGGFVLKTILARLTLWLIGFRWIGRILILVGLIAGGCFARNVTIRQVKVRSPAMIAILVNIGIVDVVVIVNWIWPVLADALLVVYLITEVTGLGIFLEHWKVGIGTGLASVFVAWLLSNWWWWIVIIEVVVAVVVLLALTIAAGIMRLWIDGVQANRSDTIRSWRKTMRKHRKAMEDEIAELKNKLQLAELKKPPQDVRTEPPKRIAR